MADQTDRDIQIIRALEPEVARFHPWLQRLLEQLPFVSSLSYSHGSDEFGADFFFELHDANLNSSTTVALVVKTGGISQKNADVDRQVQECFDIERVSLPENRSKSVGSVWVVTNGKITGNARRALSARFKGQAVNFLDEDKLASIAREHAPHLLDSLPPEVSSHNAVLRDSIIRETQRFSLFPANDSVPHIPQKLERFRSGYQDSRSVKKQLFTTLDDVLRAGVPATIIVEGEPGSGKSTLIRRCIEGLCSPESYLETTRLPIRVEIEDADHSAERAAEIVGEQLKACESGTTLPATRLVVFVDALELFIHQAIERLEWIENLSNLLTERNPDYSIRLVVATTPLGVAAHEGRLVSVRYALQDPTVNDVIQFIKGVCGEANLSNRIFSDIRSSPLFREIRSKPAAAVLLADLLRSNNEADLPTHLTELYDRYAELALGRWLPEGGVESVQYYKTALGFLSGLAHRFVEKNTTEIDIADYRLYATSYVSDRNLNIDPEKLAGWILGSHLIAEDLEAHVLFFRSRMLRDFFAAKYLAGRQGEVHLTEDFLAPSLSCVWFFYFGLRLDCPDDLNIALEVVEKDRDEQVLKMMLVPQILLAASQTEYTHTEGALKRQLLDAARLYIQARDSLGDGVLKGYSEMDLLWWFQNVLRSNYGMEHFKRAVVKCTQDPGCDSTTEDDQYARFFLSVIAMDLGINNPFGPLLDISGSSRALPTPLMLAVKHEASGSTESASVKKVLKRLGRIKGSRFSNASPFTELYDVPLANRKAING
jgi:hypothetical protein